MKKILLSIVVFLCLMSFRGISQEYFKLKTKPQIHHCPVSHEVRDHYVPAKKRTQKSKPVDVLVGYSGEIPNEARIAFEQGAVPMIQNMISSDVPLRIIVVWETDDNDYLAAAGPTAFYGGGALTPKPGRVYPVSLIEKILRTNINGEDADIGVFVNSNVNWNYDFSLTSIGSQYDFVSVIVHEIFHGLGFTTSMGLNEETGEGFYNVFTDGSHDVYADFVRLGDAPLETVEDASTAMGQALTSSNLNFERISGETHKIHAPFIYDPGSSLSHLDEQTFSSTESSLMTPFISPGKIERGAGVALEMMYDMGWDMTYINHESIPGKEDFTEDHTLEIEIESDSDFDPSTVFMHYSLDTFQSEVVVPMTFNSQTNRFSATLPAPNDIAYYQYYFEVTNARNVKFTSPGEAPALFTYTFFYDIDNIGPFITHDPLTSINNEETAVVLEALITDDLFGVDTAFVEWTINGTVQSPVGMIPRIGFDGTPLDNEFTATLVFPDGALDAGDVVTYKILALDDSKSQNQGKFPIRGDEWEVIVEQVAQAVVTYMNDFEVVSEDFAGNGFSQIISSGFQNRSMQTTHPYPEAGANNSLNLIYQLNVPIQIRENDPLIEFNEVVIVEPGEPGTTFGVDEFWDYVIVEAQKLGDTEWKPLLDGYDSSSDPAWLNRYNSAPLTASSTLYRERVIDMTASGDFVPGDRVFIRFRLFSDPAVNAWGWGVDDLFIQDVGSAVEDYILRENFTVLPNPATTEINVVMELESSSERLDIIVADPLGKQVYRKSINNVNSRINETIDIADLPSGVYFVNAIFDGKDLISKKIIKQ